MPPQKPKIGQYRHRPGVPVTVGPDGVPRPANKRRRFPYRGLVFLGYALTGPAACAAVSWVLQRPGLRWLLPRPVSDVPVPPSPGLDNVLFGAGFYETVLACGLAGWLLFRHLWSVPVAEREQQLGPRATLRHLLPQGLLLGPVLALLGLLIGVFGLYLRTAPANQPWLVRPFFALLAVPFYTASALLTGTIPLVVVLLGLVLGLATALLVAFLWPHFPEEPVFR